MAITSEPPTTETTAVRAKARPQIIAHEIRPEPKGWTSWITTTDHKKIGIMYLYTTLVFFCLGGAEALLLRIQLGSPENTFLSPEKYNQLFTMHGTTMIFLVIVPVWAGFANYVLPLMIGARDVAFPRINAWSYWMFLFGGLALYASMFFTPPEAGWFSYVPLSLKEYSPSGGQEAWIYMVHLTGLASMLGAVNFIATIHNMRAPGMGWGRIPLFVWTILIYAYLIVIALSSLAAAVTMLLLDRNFGTSFFDPTQGGSALLWQHLFWFFGHPEVYILVLPAFGVFSEVLPVFARKPIFGYKAIAASTAAIAFLGLLVWAHHMFSTPMSTVVLAFFMLSSFLIAVPTGVKIFNWIATLWRGTIEYRVPLLYCHRRDRHVPDGRDHRHLPGRLPGRLAADRHLLRRRPLPLHGLRRGRLRHGGGALLLVPEDERPDDVGEARQGLVLVLPRRLPRDLPGPALGRPVGHAAARLRVHGHRQPRDLQPDLLRRLGDPGDRRADHDHQPRALGQERGDRRLGPVEGQHARVVHAVAAAGEQLRRRSRACARSSRCATSAARSSS